MFYKLIDGEYILFNEDDIILNAGKEVCVFYDYSEIDKRGVLLKHGSYKNVNEYCKNFMEKIFTFNNETNTKLIDLKDLYLIHGKFDIEEINKCISTSDYIGLFHQKKFNSLNIKNEIILND